MKGWDMYWVIWHEVPYWERASVRRRARIVTRRKSLGHR